MTADHPNHKWWTLFAMCFALFMIMLDNTVVNVALPDIQHSLDMSPQGLQWTINAYVLTFASLILLGGKLGDRFGRKPMFILGLIVFTLASAGCALAGSQEQLIIARALQGVGGALLNPLSLSILVAAFPRPQLPAAIGIWAGVSGLGLAIGPALGGLLTERVGWEAVFWINVPIGVMAALVAAWAVVDSSDPQATKLDLVGAGLVTSGLFALTWGLIESSSHAWLGSYTLGFLVLAAALLGAFVWWESRVEQPMLPLGFFRNHVFTIANMIMLLVGFALFGVIFWMTLYFQNVLGYSPLEAGLRTLPMTAAVIVVSPIAGKLSSRTGPQPLLVVGMTATSIALLGLSRVEVDSSYTAIWPFYLLMGVGLAMSMPTVSAAAMGAIDPTKAGIASGVVNSARQVGGALGVAVLGSIAAALSTAHWKDAVADLPAAAQARALAVTDAVVGGQGGAVVEQSGSPALRTAAFESFVHGMQGALLVAAVLTFAAALLALIGLRGTAPVARPEPEPVAATSS